jgi:1,4-alpha-glucan branching enzyme
MIKQAELQDDAVKVTFAVPAEVGNVSVVGDFNDWCPQANPLKARSNGTRSVAVVLPAGATYRFRYLAEGGVFFDDDTCPTREPNGYGQTHGVLLT